MSDSAGTASAARDDDDAGDPGAAVAGSRRVAAAPVAPGSRRTGSKKDGGPGRIRSIGVFYRQVVAELRKVIWPTRQELITYTSVVLVFVVVMVLLVSALDFAFSQAVLRVFGDRGSS